MRHASKKDMSAVTHKTTRFRDAVVNKVTSADLKDHGGHATIKLCWDMNKASIRDQVFMMSINGEKAYVDLEELLSYTRLM